ncbi:DUF2934 domain-containing protein [Bradyrhizobium sp. PMVTL-01]|uniref:DUF2934 domain-containing protein n=1 Tax=Bradyrhizobium sp. PMVTL-01 TaxID=3434999 RepID=UPI003F6E87D7
MKRQLAAANRAMRMIVDEVTIERLRSFAQTIERKLADIQVGLEKQQTRTRAHQLWEEAGRPEGRDLEFWLRAEREIKGTHMSESQEARRASA